MTDNKVENSESIIEGIIKDASAGELREIVVGVLAGEARKDQQIASLEAQLAEARRIIDAQNAALAAANAENSEHKKMRGLLGKAFRSTGKIIVQKGKEVGKANKRAMLDKLTGLFNRGGMEMESQNLLAEIERLNIGEEKKKEKEDPSANGKANYLSIIAIDLDYFKKLNDTKGHKAGDKALKGVAKVMTDATRPLDICARPGGDEFRVVMHVTANSKEESINLTAHVAERILSGIRKVGFEQGAELAGSLGISSFGPLLRDFEGNKELLEQAHELADYNSYVVKANGRDGVCFTDPSGSPVIIGKEGQTLILPQREKEPSIASQPIKGGAARKKRLSADKNTP